MLTGCTLHESDRQLFDTLAPLRLRPGRRFDARAFSEAEREAIAASRPRQRSLDQALGPRHSVALFMIMSATEWRAQQ